MASCPTPGRVRRVTGTVEHLAEVVCEDALVANPIDSVRETGTPLLEPGEEFRAAARVRRRTSAAPWTTPVGEIVAPLFRMNPEGLKVPPNMIWAVTDQRLFIWSSDRLTRKKPRKLVRALRFGTEVELLSISKAGSGGLNQHALSLVVLGQPMSFEVPSELANAVKIRVPVHTRRAEGFDTRKDPQG